MLLGKLIEKLHGQIVDEHMHREPTETFGEEKHRYETSRITRFAEGELFIEGQGIEHHVVWVSQVVRPTIVSTFDIKTRGRVITVGTDKSPLGGSIQIACIATDV